MPELLHHPPVPLRRIPHRPPPDADIDYPCSDGQPVGETEIHYKATTRSEMALSVRYAGRPDVYVGANMFLYYEEGNRNACVAPDVFVVLGAEKKVRDTYKLWEEPKAPDFVLEVTSRKTRRDDEGRKREVYARIGVTEYWLYDPKGEYLRPPLKGYRLKGRRYEPIAVSEVGDGSWVGVSGVLGLELRVEGDQLRYYDPEAGEYLRTLPETEQALTEKDRALTETERALMESERALQAEKRARRETEAALQAEREAAATRIAELEARLRDLEGDPAPRR